jgi:hypothetical protein
MAAGLTPNEREPKNRALSKDERFILGRLAPWLDFPDCSLSVAVAMTMPESLFAVAVVHAQSLTLTEKTDLLLPGFA